MISKDKYIKHGCTLEKVLGYKYEAAADKIYLTSVDLTDDCDTKRKIFAQSAKVFDPLGLTSPVMVKSKLLISSLWEEIKNALDH